MKKVLLIVFLAVMVFSGPLHGAQAPTDQDAKSLAQKISRFITDNGLEKGAAEVMNGQFRRTDLFINVSDFNGVVLAHNIYPALKGRNDIAAKDSEGKLFVRDGIEIAKKGGGWMNFMWTNPKTKNIQPSKGWIERVPGMDVWVMVTIGAGK